MNAPREIWARVSQIERSRGRSQKQSGECEVRDKLISATKGRKPKKRASK